MGLILTKLFNRTESTNINLFPNEVLRTILKNLEVQQLISIRVVCRRWLILAEDICQEKRSLLIVRKDFEDIFNLTKRFNGLVDLKNHYAILKLIPNSCNEISLDFSTFLPKLFPRVENLLFDEYLDRTAGTTENLFSLLNQWSSTLVTQRLPDYYVFPESHRLALSDQLDRLTVLKRLDFDGANLIKQTTLVRLKRHSFVVYNLDKVVPHLGTCCTSLYLNGSVSLWELTQMHKLNAQLFKGLTHLRLWTNDHEALSFICANCVELKMLNIGFNLQIFNADMIAPLVQLSNLSELSINFVKINLPTLARSNLTTLNMIRKLSMSLFEVQNDGQPFDGDLFSRILSKIFTNLHHLTIQHQDPLVLEEIVQHLNRFVHLRKHDIVPY